MGKKKHRKQSGRGQGDWAETGYGQGPYNGFGTMNGPGAAPGFGPGGWNGMADAGTAPGATGFLHGLQGLAGSRQTEQFVLGALIGAAAVYVLGDEEMRGKLVRTAMKLYSGIAGGFEEFKEQMADIKAEVEAEQQG